MKKIYLIFAVIMLVVFMSNRANVDVFKEDTGFDERFNDRQIMDAVKSVSKIAGVTEVAILSQNGKILAGILTENTEDSQYIVLKAEEIIKKRFPGIVSRKVFAEDDTALDIIELSYYVESDLEPEILRRRFDYLMHK